MGSAPWPDPRPAPGPDDRAGQLSRVVSATAAAAAVAGLAHDLDRLGVAVMVLKGPPVQSRLLGTDTAYPSADIDILVPRVAAAATRAYLVGEGWRFLPHNGVLWRVDGAAAYVKDAVTVDLHWAIHAGFLSTTALRPLQEELWRGAKRTPDGWFEPDLAPLTVYLAVHVAGGGFTRPEVLRLLASAADGADPDAVADIAERVHLAAVVNDAVGRARGTIDATAAPPLPTGRAGWLAAVSRLVRTSAAPVAAGRLVRRVRASNRRPRDVVLALRALALAAAAQQVTRGVPVAEVLGPLARPRPRRRPGPLARPRPKRQAGPRPRPDPGAAPPTTPDTGAAPPATPDTGAAPPATPDTGAAPPATPDTGAAPPATPDTGAAALAAVRGCAWLARLHQGRDTCLIRAIVLAALLAGRPGVEVHIGLARDDGDGGAQDDADGAAPDEGNGAPRLSGHAWVTLDGAVLPPPADAPPGDDGLAWEELTIPVEARS